MADYEKAFRITVYGNEGFYNPGKGEAETYMGLDRSMHPKSPLWPIVDSFKKDNPTINWFTTVGISKMNRYLATNSQAQTIIKNFYKTDFWNTLRLDEVKDQQLANNLFDCSINPCIDTAAVVMQKAVAATRHDLIAIDGSVGPKTISAINSLNAKEVYNNVNAIRLANYVTRVHRSPNMLSWLPIWKNRLVPYV